MKNLLLDKNVKKSRIPAVLDLAQSGTGLVLGLFMWAHMLLVASIILGTGSFNFVARMMELSFLSASGQGYPVAVVFAVMCVFSLFILHAALGMRKFPISWRQYKTVRAQMHMMNHSDTNLWFYQAVTGFIMFFAGSVHLYIMLTHPHIAADISADRVVSSTMWPLYLVLLISVELHAAIGLYRLCMKWGWFAGKDPRHSRARLQKLKKRLTVFFLALGILSLVVFVVIGIRHRDKAGENHAARTQITAQPYHIS